MKAKDALYAEAEAVFRDLHADSVRIGREGGTDQATPVMIRRAYGFHLDDILEHARDLKRRGLHAEGTDPIVVSVKRLPGRSKSGSVLAMAFCVDSTGWGFYDKTGRLVTPGGVAIDDTYFAKTDGVLKIIGADGREVEKCD
ncbi:MAG: hypothetical protein VB093_03350 [Propionicimonas sp.]|nr:hypothetical protein [Propionicimonas sp.]